MIHLVNFRLVSYQNQSLKKICGNLILRVKKSVFNSHLSLKCMTVWSGRNPYQTTFPNTFTHTRRLQCPWKAKSQSRVWRKFATMIAFYQKIPSAHRWATLWTISFRLYNKFYPMVAPSVSWWVTVLVLPLYKRLKFQVKTFWRWMAKHTRWT